MTHNSSHFNKELQIAIKRHNIIHATLLKASMFYKTSNNLHSACKNFLR